MKLNVSYAYIKKHCVKSIVIEQKQQNNLKRREQGKGKIFPRLILDSYKDRLCDSALFVLFLSNLL